MRQKLLPLLPYALIILAVCGLCWGANENQREAGANALRAKQQTALAKQAQSEAKAEKQRGDMWEKEAKAKDSALKLISERASVSATRYRKVRDSLIAVLGDTTAYDDNAANTDLIMEVVEAADSALREKEVALAVAHQAISARDSLLASKDREIDAKDRQITALNGLNHTLKSEIRRRKTDKLFTYIKAGVVGYLAGEYVGSTR